MTLVLHAIRRMRTSVLAFGIGLAVWGSIYVFIFPVMQDSMAELEYPPEILEAFGASGSDLSDPRLFFDVEFFALAPIVMAVFAVIAGTGALAGEESGGTIDFLAAMPLSRRQLFVQKALAVAVGVLIVTSLTASVWLLTAPVNEVGPDLTAWELFVTTYQLAPFVLLVAGVGLFLGAIAPSRSTAAAWTGGFVIVAYLLVLIAAITDEVEWLRYVSPYYYTDLQGILEEGLDASHQFVLWTMTVLTYASALRAFEGRELSAERWQWGALLRGAGAVVPDETAGTAETEGTTMTTTTPRPHRRGRTGGRRTWLLVVVMLAVVGLVAGVLVAGGAERLWAPSAQRVVTASGRVDAPSAAVAAPTTGRASIVLAREGDDVRQGQVLGWVTSSLDGSEQPLVAPLSGALTTFTLARGQAVVVGTPLGDVHQVADPYAVIEVSERDVQYLAVGQRAEVIITALGRNVTSAVTAVSRHPISETGTGRDKPKYEVRCALPNDDRRVAIGMRVDVRIEAGN